MSALENLLVIWRSTVMLAEKCPTPSREERFVKCGPMSRSHVSGRSDGTSAAAAHHGGQAPQAAVGAFDLAHRAPRDPRPGRAILSGRSRFRPIPSASVAHIDLAPHNSAKRNSEVRRYVLMNPKAGRGHTLLCFGRGVLFQRNGLSRLLVGRGGRLPC